MNFLVGRVTPCAPGAGNPSGGAHGVTRPTHSGSPVIFGWHRVRFPPTLGAQMKALVLEQYNKFAYTDLPAPEPGADEVLVAVRACGICGRRRAWCSTSCPGAGSAYLILLQP